MSDDQGTQAKQATPDKPKRHRLLKIAAISAVVLLVAFIILPYVLPTSWLAKMAETAIASKVRRPVELGGVSWGWLGGISVEDVTVGEAAEFGGGTFVRAGKVSARVSLFDLIRKKVSVRSVTIVAPEITIIRSQDGAWNFDTLLAAEESPRSVQVASLLPLAQSQNVDIAVERIRIRGGKVAFEDRRKQVAIAATDVSADLDADFSGPLIAGSADLSFDLKQETGDARFELAAANLTIPKSTSKSAADEVAVSGTLKLTDIDIAEAMAAASPESGRNALGGRLSLELDYDVKNGKVALKSRDGTVRKLIIGREVVSSGPVEVGDVTFSFDASASRSETEDSLSVTALELRTSFADIVASLDAKDSGGIKKASLSAGGSIVLASLPKGLVELPEDVDISGPLKFQASVSGSPATEEFTVTLDAGAMGIAAGSTVKKASGKTSLIKASGRIASGKIEADTLRVDLGGAAFEGSAGLDTGKMTANWKMAGNLDGFNLSDYYTGSKGLKVSGAFANEGVFMLGSPTRSSDFIINTNIDSLALDAVDNPGIEATMSGALDINSARAQARNLVVALGGKPLAVDALIRTPLERPQGKVTVRGKEISLDSALAVGKALAATSQSDGDKPAEPSSGAVQTAEGKAEKAGDIYISNADVTLDAVVDNVIYGDYTGTNLVVDAALVAGKAVVRKATVNMFGGRIDLTANYDLTAADQPFEASIAVAKLKAAQPTRDLLSAFLPGLSVDGTVDLGLKASGKGSGEISSVLDSLTGDGLVDITDGKLAVSGFPQTIASLAKVDVSNLDFSKISVPLRLAGGAVHFDYEIEEGKDSVFIKGRVLLAGGYEQEIGYTPGGTSARIHLINDRNGKISFVEPEKLIADLAKAQLSGVLGSGDSDDGDKSREEQIIEGVGELLDLLEKKKD